MSLLEFIRLLSRYWKALVILPLCTALVVFYLTKSTKKEYTSSCEVYTGIASGYGITSGENDRVDYFAVNNAFDNLMATIKSRETVEEVGLRLLAKHLMVKKPSYAVLSKDHFDHLNEIFPPALRKKLVHKSSEELTYLKLENYRLASTNNEIIDLLKKGSEIYSFDHISSNMSALRKQSSDMINISYKCDDPAACQQTLQLIVDVVMIRYKGIKGSETNNVVKYFEEQLRLAALRLRKSEDRLRDYSSENKIINYYEQAKFVAESKENVLADKQRQEMDLDASIVAMAQIEKKIDVKKGLLEVNDKLLKLREQLADANYKIANAELYNEATEKIGTYKNGAEQLKRQIREEVEKQYKLNNTTEGLPRMQLLQEWLNNYLAVEENKAKLNVINIRLDGYDALYSELAPIGSNLKRIEREVDVNEKEYLSVLHGLNMARLRQQSLEMSNNLTITDSPFLPLEPLPSKRMMLVIASFLAVFIFTLAVIIAKSLLGKTIQTPARAEKYTGLPFLSALPNFNQLHKNIIVNKLEKSLLSHIGSSLKLQIKNSNARDPQYICLVSTQQAIGKTFIAEKIAKAFNENGRKATTIATNGSSSGKLLEHQYNNELSFDEWMKSQNLSSSTHDTFIIELTSLNKYQIPEEIIAKSTLNLVVLDAESVWNESDSRALNFFLKSVESKSHVLLNNIEIDRLESIIGEIPKKRSVPRRIIKRIVTFNFKRT